MNKNAPNPPANRGTGDWIGCFLGWYKVHKRKVVLLLLVIGISGVTVGAYAESLLPTHT